MLALMVIPAQAEPAQIDGILDGIGFDEIAALEEITDGFNARSVLDKLVSGELTFDQSTLARLLRGLGTKLRDDLLRLLLSLASPVLGCLVMRVMLGKRGGAANGVILICRVSCAAILMQSFIAARSAAGELLQAATRIVNVASPVLISAVSLTGATASATILTPMSALCASIVENALGSLGLTLCFIAAAVAVSGNLSDHFRLNRLFSLLKGGTIWLVGLLMAGFTGILSVEGVLGASQDSAAIRSARYAVENMVPIIGGEVSNTMDSLAGSTVIVKNAVGITGMLLLLSACAKPLVQIAVATLSMKTAAAVIEPVADYGVANTASQFADTAEMLLAVCAGCLVLALLMMGACLSAAGNIVR